MEEVLPFDSSRRVAGGLRLHSSSKLGHSSPVRSPRGNRTAAGRSAADGELCHLLPLLQLTPNVAPNTGLELERV
ncbi:unnamed protein product [Boreogadus saida]